MTAKKTYYPEVVDQETWFTTLAQPADWAHQDGVPTQTYQEMFQPSPSPQTGRTNRMLKIILKYDGVSTLAQPADRAHRSQWSPLSSLSW